MAKTKEVCANSHAPPEKQDADNWQAAPVKAALKSKMIADDSESESVVSAFEVETGPVAKKRKVGYSIALFDMMA